MQPDPKAVREYLLGLQDSICAALESEDGEGRFGEDSWERPEGGGGRTRILSEGAVFEKAGVAFSHVTGSALPPAASAQAPGHRRQAVERDRRLRRHPPEQPLRARGPRECPLLLRRGGSRVASWWFGGGFDLTPYYGFEEDAAGWHRAARPQPVFLHIELL